MDWRYVFENADFWAVKYARKAIELAKKKGKGEVICRCASTPTGVIHIGNANEVIRNFFVAKCIEMLGFKARIIYTSDDRDPQRGFPGVICDRDGNLVKFEEKEEYEKKYEGYPVCFIPDPFKCHSSWSEHFVSVFLNELKRLGIEVEYYSPNILYYTGEWDEFVKKVLEEKELVKEIYKGFKQHIREFAFSPICPNCGRIGTTMVTSYDKERGVVRFVCGGRHLKKKTVEGCGYEGECPIRFGKVDWYIEWAINWAYFDTDIEPLGKEHYESSFKISPKFLRRLFNREPPVMLVYEFFTVNGEKMSGSKGNIYNLSELLKFLEPEVILFFYSKKLLSERDINLSRVNILVDEFDELERKVYETVRAVDSGSVAIEELKRSSKDYASLEELAVYYICTHGKVRKPALISYNFASVIGQIARDREKIIEILRRTGHYEDDRELVERAVKRVELARYWVAKYAPEEFRFSISSEKVSLSSEEREIVEKVLKVVRGEKDFTPEKLQEALYSIAKSYDVRSFFRLVYRILIGKEKGPRLGTLISALGKEKVVERLEGVLCGS